MPTSMYTGPDTQFDDMPSSEQIDSWQQDETKGPVVKEAAADKPLKEEPPKEVDATTAPKGETEETPPIEAKPEDSKEIKGEKKTRYQLAKEQSEKQAKEDEHKRNEAWKAVRLEQQKIDKERQELENARKGLEYTPDQWLQLAQKLENNGQYEDAELARQKAAEVQQYQQQSQAQQKSQQEIEQQWHMAEQDIARQDPMFFQEGSWVRKGMEKIFSDPAQASMYYQHPMGVWAAYWNVCTQYAREVIPPLVKYCQELESEVQKYRKATEPLGSAPRGASLEDGKKFTEMSDAQQAAALQKQFESM